jgi:hypothetical protein
MSRDIFVMDLPRDAATMDDITEDFQPQPLGRRSEIIRRIVEIVPETDFSDPSWGMFDGPDFSIEFNMGRDEETKSFALHVRGGDATAGLIADLLDRCGWRAVDSASESGLFDPASAAESLRKWRTYRNRVLGSDAER